MSGQSSQDIDPEETKEWLEALASIIRTDGVDRANYIIKQLLEQANISGCSAANTLTTPYKNTIETSDEAKFPGDYSLEQRVRALIRWNAAAMVVRAGRFDPDLGGHIGSFASSATLYDVGFNHFWRAPSDKHGGDLVFIQGHTAPGIYARSFLEGRLSKEQLENFRQEVEGKGLSSYPHPWLMPEYWQFPTVSMGLGPIKAIYQARYMKYLSHRKLQDTTDRHVWCFCGDGEMDEPESLGALTVAGRENLDNLIFVINCNLQRLDGPVRGNSKIIQELEGIFRGAGWNVIKVIWGSDWDPLLAKDTSGKLMQVMEETIDGEYQNFKAHGGAYTREHFFGKYPETAELVKDLSDEDIYRLKRGGHDAKKLYAAYYQAMHHKGQPTVILAKTVKGYGLGTAGEALNTAHNTKKMAAEQLKAFRDRFNIPIPDETVADAPFYRPDEDSPEIRYIRNLREKLGGGLPQRRTQADESLTIPPLSAFDGLLKGSGEREISTTMAFVRLITTLCKDKSIGKRIVPIVPDEARTFGMEGLFRQLGIYSSKGQLYTPVDSDQVMFYKEATDGQILEEGINEAGAFSSWIAAATSYSTHNLTTIPFYIYYSMFGFQRVGDLAWAAGDSRAKGFLIGATSGRTTLNGEGLQHEDGHSHIIANTIPNCITYDPTFSYELAVIIQHGLKRMYEDNEDIFFYITTMNENYQHPEMPKKAEEGIIKGMYLLQQGAKKAKYRTQLLGSGTILREVIFAAELLKKDFEVEADIWSVTSFNELTREGLDVERWNRLHPTDKPKKAYVSECLEKTEGPVVAATDYMRQYAEGLRAHFNKTYVVLGTDGFGRSDTRASLRAHFEVDRYHVVIAALSALVQEGAMKADVVTKAMKLYQINPDKPNPVTL